MSLRLDILQWAMESLGGKMGPLQVAIDLDTYIRQGLNMV
jgi:hypothetical protein